MGSQISSAPRVGPRSQRGVAGANLCAWSYTARSLLTLKQDFVSLMPSGGRSNLPGWNLCSLDYWFRLIPPNRPSECHAPGAFPIRVATIDSQAFCCEIAAGLARYSQKYALGHQIRSEGVADHVDSKLADLRKLRRFARNSCRQVENVFRGWKSFFHWTVYDGQKLNCGLCRKAALVLILRPEVGRLISVGSRPRRLAGSQINGDDFVIKDGPDGERQILAGTAHLWRRF
jgi:hypothetical protein